MCTGDASQIHFLPVTSDNIDSASEGELRCVSKYNRYPLVSNDPTSSMMSQSPAKNDLDGFPEDGWRYLRRI
jgi:hypothetical protein